MNRSALIAIAALILLGAIVVARNKNGEEIARVKVPEGAKVEVLAKVDDPAGARAVEKPAAQRPALVVVVSIDQFPFEYLERMRKGFAADGMFNRFLDHGAVFSNCHHGHAFTYTAPGHSVLLTGAFPNVNGIVGNEWYDRTKGKSVYCVADEKYPLVGNPLPVEEPAEDPKASAADVKKAKKKPPEGVSPRTLLAGTLGDVMKLVDPRSKVCGVALKDRAAVLMSGHQADGAFWFDADTGHWVTSKYYHDELPGYLRNFNESNAGEAYLGQTWDLLLDRDQYVDYYGSVKASLPILMKFGLPRSIPKEANAAYYKAMTVSPFGSALTLEAAKVVMTYEKLGADDVPDLLAINLSSNDYVGHAFGPQSIEVQDITYRTDRLLGQFADFVEKQLAGRPWVMALSSDHGVAPVPEYAAAIGLPAVRNPLGSVPKVREQLEQRLVDQLGKLEGETTYIEDMDENSVYLRRGVKQLDGEQFATAQRIVRQGLVENPVVAAAFTRDELSAQNASIKGLGLAFQRTFNMQRSGDVLFALQPYCISGATPATHGSPWEYDSHVPLMFWGHGIKPGRYSTSVTPAAMAPTLARLLCVDPPSSNSVEAADEALRPPVALGKTSGR